MDHPEPLNRYPFQPGDVQRPSGDHARTLRGDTWSVEEHDRAHEELDQLPWSPEPLVAILDAMHNPNAWEQARQYTEMLQASQRWVRFMSDRRNEAVRQMRREGASYDRVAAALGISKSRAQSLCNRLEKSP